MDECIFCKIIENKSPASKIYEDKSFLAFLDTQPINQGHTLVIPKIHKKLLNELDDKLIAELMVLGGKVSKAVKKSRLNPDGINYFLADGAAAGQEIFHVHLHIIPRFDNDGFGFIFPDGYTSKPERNNLDKIAQEIRANVSG
jgi:histidine triad (HIT) family protein